MKTTAHDHRPPGQSVSRGRTMGAPAYVTAIGLLIKYES